MARHSLVISSLLAVAGVVAVAACRHASLRPSPVASAIPANPASSFTIRNVRVFDGERVLEDRVVVVAGGRIAKMGGAEIPPTGAEIDGRGRTLLPGLIDAHVHVGDQVDEALAQAASLGITTVVDMFNGGERFRRLLQARSEEAPHLASIVTAGTGASAPGGHPAQMGGPPFPTIGVPADAQAFVDARIAEGSDFLKVIYDDLREMGFAPVPMLDRATVTALVRAAHQRGRLAVVHAGSEAQARDAVEAGADGLAHLFLGETTPQGFGELVKRHGSFVVPTLSVLEGSCGRPRGAELLGDANLRPFIRPEWRERLAMSFGRAERPCKATGDALRQLDAAGAPILAGTDSPIPGTTYGASLHGELALLVSHGLTPIAALAAATSAPAGAFRLRDRGLVRKGMRADLVLVEGNPTADILATRRIVHVWKAGVEVERPRFP
jgi:imidazolonepropionase-like amidohydrolase